MIAYFLWLAGIAVGLGVSVLYLTAAETPIHWTLPDEPTADLPEHQTPRIDWEAVFLQEAAKPPALRNTHRLNRALDEKNLQKRRENA